MLGDLYRILWHPEETVTEGSFPTVHAAEKFARESLRPFDVVWAGSKTVLPDWYRQMMIERGE